MRKTISILLTIVMCFIQTVGLAESAEQQKSEMAYEVTYMNVKSYTNNSGSVRAEIIIEIENTGKKLLYVDSGTYDLEDENGKLISGGQMIHADPQVIAPGEKAYYFDDMSLKLSEQIELVVIPYLKVELSNIDNINLSITDFSISEGEHFAIEMLGRVENTTDDEQNDIWIIAILFDDDNHPIARLYTTTTAHRTLAPGDKRGFEGTSGWSSYGVTIDMVARYEVFAYPNYFFNKKK